MEVTTGSLCPLLLILVSFTLTTAVPRLMVIGPDVFHHGREETLSLNLLSHNAQVQVTVSLQDFPARASTFSQKTVTVQPNQAMLTTVTVSAADLPETEPPVSHVYLKVIAPAINFQKEMKVLVSSQSHLVFIQTDKPLYTPRQKVNVRVFTMDHDMRPANVPIRLDIVTPQGIIVQRREIRNENGINSDGYTFPSISMLGNWSWVAAYGHQYRENVSARFEVREYELPTFQVKVFAPDVILPTDTHISAQIEAKHSYGEPVSGFSTVKLYVKQGDELTYFTAISERLHLEHGTHTFDLPIEHLTNLGQRYNFPTIEGARLYVEATVRERSTGKKMTTIDQTAIFASSPFKITFERSSRYFKPSLPYVVRMNVRHANGNPAAEIPVRVTAMATSSDGVETAVVSYVSQGGQVENEVTSDEMGRARHTLNVSPDTRSIRITVETVVDSVAAVQQGRGVLIIASYSSPSNSYIMIRPKIEVAQVGILEAEVFMTNTAQASRMTYMVISRGKIMRQQTLQRAAGTFTTLHIPITPAMAPNMRLLVYYIHPGGEVIADSMWVDVQNICENEMAVSVSPAEDYYKPSDNVRLRVRGEPGTYVALMAVDQAVYFLNDKKALTRQKMFDRLDEQDLGCTPGGGLNSLGVFTDSGIMGITNAHLVPPTRPARDCPAANNRRRRSLDNPSLTNLNDCCERGRLLMLSLNRSSCASYAAQLPDASNACKNEYFRCCMKAFRDNNTEVEEERRGRQGRANSGQAIIDVKFKLIRTSEDNVEVRSKFDESWMLPTRQIGDNGELSMPVTLMDSITTWMVQAVGVSHGKGMCVANPHSIKVFKEVFLQVNLPYSAIHMEQLEVKATLYNYARDEINAILNLEGDTKICYGARHGENTPDIMISVPARESRVISWPIIPLQAGTAILKVKAFTSRGSDIVEKHLVVVPPGKQISKTQTLVLDPQNVLAQAGQPAAGNGRQVNDVPLRPPAEAVPGSAHCTIGVTGTVMGPVVEQLLAGDGLNHLIRLPRGCGEQTLIRLGPLVYVAKYLRTSDQMGNREQQIHENIRSGIQHEMQYRRPGGGFAVWTTYKPSTWLTTFAVKIFSQAREFNVLNDDPSEIICTAVEWLSQQQRATGVYYDGYKVHHREMTGGVQGDTTFTAYVLIGMLQSNCQNPRVQQSMLAAITYLEGQIDTLNRPYAAALVAYALSLTDSPHKQRANNKLKTMVADDQGSGFRHWPANQGAFQGSRPFWYTRKPLAIEIETASYAILTQLKLEDVGYAGPIIKWLLAQRQGNGAYISTQDTVVALEALSEYSRRTADSTLDLSCRIDLQSDRADPYQKQIGINEENAEVRASKDVSSYLGGDMTIQTTGEGVGQVEIDMVYNVANTDGEECHFDLTIQVREQVIEVVEIEPEDDEDDHWDLEVNVLPQQEEQEQEQVQEEQEQEQVQVQVQVQVQINQAGSGDFDRRLPQLPKGNVPNRSRFGAQNPQPQGRGRSNDYMAKITICTKYNGEQDTGMVILDVGLFTGFEVVEDSLRRLKMKKTIENYELTDRSVQFYLSSVKKDGPGQCFEMLVRRVSYVGLTHPVAVTIYDYYEPSISCTKFYHPEGEDQTQLQTMCNANRDVCSCAETICGNCYGMEDIDERPWSDVEMMSETCSSVYVYALKVTVLASRFDTSAEKVDVRVNAVLKTAQRQIASGDDITLYKKSACPCPELLPNKSYYIIGHEGSPLANEHDEQVYKYLLDDRTYVVEVMKKTQHRRFSKEWNQARSQHLWFRTMNRGRGCTN